LHPRECTTRWRAISLRSKHLSRGNGARAIRATAYRAGERIRDQRSGETHDYSGRNDVVHKGIVLPAELAGGAAGRQEYAIQEMLKTALARGDRALVADPDGGYRRRFFNAARGDVVLNPFDEQGRHRDLFG
jgi:hypothetical protein